MSPSPSNFHPGPPAAAAPAWGQRLRVLVTLGITSLLLAATVAVFRYQDGRYSLPAARPAGLRTVAAGEIVALPPGVGSPGNGRPVFLHFFNPDCPCSRFNAEHVRDLHRRFGDRVNFVAVVQAPIGSTTDPAAARENALAAAARLLGPDLAPTAVADGGVDEDGAIAAASGVYSTPQAVLLGPGSELIFRGNYNVSRYCADPRTEFARLALEAFVERRPLPPAAREAMVAYGCELPANHAVANAGAAAAATAGKRL